MAKVYHENVYNIIQNTLNDAKSRGVIHLLGENDHFSGRVLRIHDADMINFGTCGYLGLETQPALIETSIDYLKRYGTQFSMSRTYVSMGINEQLESLLSEMYRQAPVIVQSSTSLTHLSLVPVLMGLDDLVILDQQAHASMQSVVQISASSGTSVTMIRHNDMDMLEHTIQKWADKKAKIWYVIDGVYSMFGDPPHFSELKQLMDKYQNLNLYVDDAHGMSWYGEHGTGYFYNHFGLNSRVVLVSTLAKGFGCTGGFAIFSDRQTYEKIKIYGGPLAHSHPLTPANIGAATASAKLHLSGGLVPFQQALATRIALCTRLLANTQLPVISHPETPIFFIGVKHPRLGYNILNRMLAEGFYFNIALFPAVPAKNTGLRFTITNHVSEQDIAAFVQALDKHYHLALAEEKLGLPEVNKAFGLSVSVKEKTVSHVPQAEGFITEVYHSVKEIDKEVWNPVFENEGLFNWEGLQFLETAFSGNLLPEQNWKFYYILVRSEKDRSLVCATFFTLSLFKDDFLSPPDISLQVEKTREQDKYYLTSRTLMMGSTLTEGEHLYINRQVEGWETALHGMFTTIFSIQEKEKADNIILRDFAESDTALKSFFHDHGFSSVRMPNSNIISGIGWHTTEELLAQLTPRNKRHLKYEVLRHAHLFDVEIKNTLSPAEQAHFYELFLNVKRRNFGVNFFDYPPTIVSDMSADPNWEFISIKFSAAAGINKHEAIACGFCYKGRSAYIPVIIGMDYDYVFDYHTYKQTLYQMLRRAQALGYNKVYFGFSADTEKRKLGAEQVSKSAYLYMSDTYHFELLETIRN